VRITGGGRAAVRWTSDLVRGTQPYADRVVNYRPGDRVELVVTGDRLTDLRPGDQGTVTRYDRERQMVYVDWDTGSKLSMCLDADDVVRTVGLAELDADGPAVDPEAPTRSALGTPPGGPRPTAGEATPAVVAAAHLAAATLLGVERSTLDDEDLASLRWIIDRVVGCVTLERIEGNLSAVGRVVGAVGRHGNDVPAGEAVDAVLLRVLLEPSGDRVLWPLDMLIAAHQQECLFDVR
jgi:hypothetical protein